MKPILPAVTMFLSLLAGVSQAHAQTRYARPATSPNPQPAVSPYLNIVRQGSSPGVNYFDLVRPQFEFRSAVQQLQQDVTTLATNPSGEQASNLPVTGHPVQFLNLSHYFNTGRPGSSQSGSGGTPSSRGTAGRR